MGVIAFFAGGPLHGKTQEIESAPPDLRFPQLAARLMDFEDAPPNAPIPTRELLYRRRTTWLERGVKRATYDFVGPER